MGRGGGAVEIAVRIIFPIRSTHRLAATALGAVLAASAARAADTAVGPPALKAGDNWVIKETIENAAAKTWAERRQTYTIERVGSANVLLGVKLENSPAPAEEHLIGPDWSILKNFNGEQVTTAKPLSFPLTVGKSWTIEFTDPTPAGRVKSTHYRDTYTVIGWEDVEVPAGKFHALKIEDNGTWKAELAPAAGVASQAATTQGGSTIVMHSQAAAAGTIFGQNYKALYYVPELKHFAKTVEETFNGQNVRTRRVTNELELFKPAA